MMNLNKFDTSTPDSQRSLEEVREIRLLPAHEFPMNDNYQRVFPFQLERERFEGNPSKYTTYKDIENGIASPGIEKLSPAFLRSHGYSFRFLSAIPPSSYLSGEIEEAIIQFDRENEERAKVLKSRKFSPGSSSEKNST